MRQQEQKENAKLARIWTSQVIHIPVKKYGGWSLRKADKSREPTSVVGHCKGRKEKQELLKEAKMKRGGDDLEGPLQAPVCQLPLQVELSGNSDWSASSMACARVAVVLKLRCVTPCV